MPQRSEQAHSFLYTASSKRKLEDEVCLHTATQRFKQEKNLKSMHLHKRLWVVSFSIQLEREWTSTHTHIFNHPRADSSQSLLLLSEPHSLHVQLWRAKEEGTKSPLIKKAQWYHLVLTHKCYRFEVWPHQDVTHSVEGEGKITHKHTNK